MILYQNFPDICCLNNNPFCLNYYLIVILENCKVIIVNHLKTRYKNQLICLISRKIPYTLEMYFAFSLNSNNNQNKKSDAFCTA